MAVELSKSRSNLSVLAKEQEIRQALLYRCRKAISWKPEETIKNDLELLRDEQQLSPDLVFRDPYFLDFLSLKDCYSGYCPVASRLSLYISLFLSRLQ